jgi:hypothetical protein
MEFYLGGYYLVKQNDLAHWKGRKPNPAWTVSNCINDIYPSDWAFDWLETSEEQQFEVRKELTLDAEQYKAIQAWIAQQYQAEQFDWPNLFRDRETARQFACQYTQHLPNVKLLGIYLPACQFEAFIADIQPANHYPGVGIYRQLIQKIVEDQEGQVLGYDILGIEYSGDFHCFLCNGLEKAYREQFGITFNGNGLLPTWEDAQKVIGFTASEETGAEPVPWAIWKVKEFEIGH